MPINLDGFQIPTGGAGGGATPPAVPPAQEPPIDGGVGGGATPPAQEPPAGIPNGDDGKPVHDYVVGTQLDFGDNKILSIAPNGDLVDAENKVVKEAKEVKGYLQEIERNASIDAANVASVISETLGINPVDENGKPITIESVDDIKAYLTTVSDTYYNSGRKDGLDELYKTYPVIKDVIQHLILNNNSLENFNHAPKYADMAIDENNKEQQKSILLSILKATNVTNAAGYVDYVEKSGTLYTEANNALTNAKAQERAAEEQRAAAVAAKQEADRIASEKYYGALKSTYVSGQIGNYNIPEKIVVTRDGQKVQVTREELFNYTARIVDKAGHTMADIDYANMPQDKRIQFDALTNFLLFTGGDLQHLAAIEAAKNRVIEIKNLGKGGKGNSFTVVNPNKPTGGAGGTGVVNRIDFNKH